MLRVKTNDSFQAIFISSLFLEHIGKQHVIFVSDRYMAYKTFRKPCCHTLFLDWLKSVMTQSWLIKES